MKVTISARTQFSVPLTEQHLQDLFRCAEHHYDARCRQYGREGGLVQVWLRRYKFTSELPEFKPEDFVVVCSWQDLDTCAKILEVGRYDADAGVRDRTMELGRQFSALLRLGNAHVANWHADVEV